MGLLPRFWKSKTPVLEFIALEGERATDEEVGTHANQVFIYEVTAPSKETRSYRLPRRLMKRFDSECLGVAEALHTIQTKLGIRETLVSRVQGNPEEFWRWYVPAASPSEADQKVQDYANRTNAILQPYHLAQDREISPVVMSKNN